MLNMLNIINEDFKYKFRYCLSCVENMILNIEENLS